MNILNRNKYCKIIHTSTSEVYGNPVFIPITEEHPVSGTPTLRVKLQQIRLHFLMRSLQITTTILRPSNTFGPRQSARAVIPTIISHYLNKVK